MTIKEAGAVVKEALTHYYDVREASAITDLVLEDLTGLSRVDRILHDRDLMDQAAQRRLQCEIKYLERRMPVQYVLGFAYFAGLKLKVNNQVLIPRPETEELVQWVTQTVREDALRQKAVLGEKSLLDMGSGSGCIPLAVKNGLPELKVNGCDIADGALGVARHNARLLGLDVSFFKLDILNEQQTAALPELDYIVSNPPYIHHDEQADMEPHVLDYEPHLALFPDRNLPATIFYRKIAALAGSKLRNGGTLFLEINPVYVNDIIQMLKNEGGGPVEVRRDLQNQERMVKCLFKR